MPSTIQLQHFCAGKTPQAIPQTHWSRCDEEAAAVWLTTFSVNFGMGVGFGWRHQIAITMAPTPSKPDRFDTAGLLSVWGLRGAKSRPGGDD